MGPWKSQPGSWPRRWRRAGAWAALLLPACHRSPAAPVAAAPETVPSAPAMAPLPDLPSALAEAQALWPRRHQRSELDAVLAALERAYLLDPSDAEVAAQLAHGYFLLGHHFLRPSHDRTGMHRAFGRGVVVAEMGLRTHSAAFAGRLAQGQSVEDALDALDATAMATLVAYTENLGALSALRGHATSLFFGERLRACIDRMLTLNERFADALPHRFSAIWLSRMPAFAGGDKAAGAAEFDAAQRLAPTSVANALGAAQATHSAAALERLRALLARQQAPSSEPVDPVQALVYGEPERELAKQEGLALVADAPAPPIPQETP